MGNDFCQIMHIFPYYHDGYDDKHYWGHLYSTSWFWSTQRALQSLIPWLVNKSMDQSQLLGKHAGWSYLRYPSY